MDDLGGGFFLGMLDDVLLCSWMEEKCTINITHVWCGMVLPHCIYSFEMLQNS